MRIKFIFLFIFGIGVFLVLKTVRQSERPFLGMPITFQQRDLRNYESVKAWLSLSENRTRENGKGCWEAYLQTLDMHNSVDYVPDKAAMMEPRSVRIMCGMLSSFGTPEVLEWGSGVSTLFFSRFAKRWHSIEHDVEWEQQFEKDLRAKSLLAPEGVVSLELIPPDIPFLLHEDGTALQFSKYCDAPGSKASNQSKYDVVLVDGRARVACAVAVLRDHLLRDERSVVIIHDFERREYHEVLSYYDVVEWERTEPRHIIVLRPKPNHPPVQRELRGDEVAAGSSSELKKSCWDQYLATIDTSKGVDYVPGKSVMMDRKSVRVMCDTLSSFEGPEVLEWGCGGSTLFFSRFAKRWHSIEHDVGWGQQFEKDLRAKSLLAPEGVVSLELIPPDIPFLPHEDGTALQFSKYCDAPRSKASNQSKYDVVLVDGRARVACAVAVLRDHLLRDERSVVIIHDFERREYHGVLSYYDVVEWERTEPRHIIVLRPKPNYPPVQRELRGDEVAAGSSSELKQSCWDQYLATIDTSKGVDYVPGKSVMMDRKSVRVMCDTLSSFAGPEVLEWGCGGSTLFFSRFAKRWHSIEHDVGWGQQFEKDLRAKSLLAPEGVVSLELIPPDIPFLPHEDGTALQFSKYCDAPGSKASNQSKYDVVLVDGRARVACAVAVLRDHLLRDERSVVIIHDFERREYHTVFNHYDVVEWERTEPRHLVVLRPKPNSPRVKGEQRGDALPISSEVAVGSSSELKQSCWDQYLATIDTSKGVDYVPGKSVMMDRKSVRVMCDTLSSFAGPEVLEWGCGGSTLFFSRFAKRWHSIEHDVGWGQQFEKDLRAKSLLAPEGVVSLELIPPDIPLLSRGDGTALQFSKYCNAPGSMSNQSKYDVVLVDGRARVACAVAVLRNSLLRDERSVVIIHDFERREYHRVLNHYDVVEWERTEPRHLVVLRPKLIHRSGWG